MSSRMWYRVAIAPLLLVGGLEMGCGSNEAPKFSQGPSAAGEEVAPGAPVQLSAEATDADGDALRYAWRQEPAEPAGTFSDAATPSPTWTAPRVTQEVSFQLVARVTDPEGASVEGGTTVRVRPATQPNVAPVVTQAASASPSPVVGRVAVQLGVQATDANNDALTYAWTQVPATPAGAFSDAASRTPTWTPPEVTAPTTFTLRAVVSDAGGLGAQSQVAVEARPAVANNTAPTLGTPTVSAASVRAGDEVTLTVTASDTDGDPLTYDWTQATLGAQGTFTSGKATAQAKWYSPPVAAETDITFNVTVRDGKGGEASKPVTVRVTVPRYAADIQPMWSVCTGCHNDTKFPSGELTLTATASYANLVSQQARSNCTTLMRVKPGEPDDSVLVRRVSSATCGDRMPRSNPTHFDSRPGELVRLRSWILAGAAND